VDADKAGLERVDDAVVVDAVDDDAVDTTPDGLEEHDFVNCRVPTRSAVAPGDETFAINLPVFADDTSSRELFVLAGVFVMVLSMCDEADLEKKVWVKHCR